MCILEVGHGMGFCFGGGRQAGRAWHGGVQKGGELVSPSGIGYPYVTTGEHRVDFVKGPDLGLFEASQVMFVHDAVMQ